MGRWNELRELTRHRTLAFLRQPEAVFWVFAFPMLLAAVLGYAFQSSEPAPSRIAVLDEEFAGSDDGIRSDGGTLLARLESDPLAELVRFEDREAAELALRTARVDALLLQPHSDPPTLRHDPLRPEAEVARLRVLVARGELDPVELALDAVTERGARYIDFLFPGLLGMNLMGTGLWSIGFAVAELRQRKVLKRLLVTPMHKSSFLASFLISRLLFLALEVLVLTSFGAFVLDVPFRGGLLQFSLLCLFGAVSFAGLGLLAASRVKTIEGASGMINLIMMPMWLGSGVFFSYERFPEVVQPVLALLPLTALNDALRQTMLEGAGLLAVTSELGLLAVWTLVPFLVALKVFRWS